MAAPPKTSRDLQTAIDDDRKKQAINDAKFRAVAQHEDYETFKNMVAVAHLKPLQAPPRPKEPTAPAFAFDSDGGRDASNIMAPPSAMAVQTQPGAQAARAPATEAEFERQWNANAGRRAAWLVADVPPSAFPKVFMRELPSHVLADVVAEMHAAVTAQPTEAEAHAWTFEALEALQGAGRFAFALRKLDAASKQTLVGVFDALANAAAVSPSDVAGVRRRYRV